MRKNFIFYRKSWSIQKNDVPLHRNTGFSAVGSALRSGRRGRAFESPNPDCKQERLPLGSLSCLCLLAPGAARNPPFLFSKDKLVGLGVIKVAFLLRERRSCFIFLIFSFYLCLERLPFGFSPICFPYDLWVSLSFAQGRRRSWFREFSWFSHVCQGFGVKG